VQAAFVSKRQKVSKIFTAQELVQ